MKLQTLTRPGTEIDRVIDELIGNVTDIEDLQSLSRRLCSPRLALLGRGASLEELCAQLARDYGIRVCYMHTDVPEDINPTPRCRCSW